MAHSYKWYSDTKEVMKKYVNATEGSIIYSLGKTRFMTLAKEADAIYKVGASALVNTEVFEEYLKKYLEPSRPLPKHVYKKVIEQKETPKIGVNS